MRRGLGIGQSFRGRLDGGGGLCGEAVRRDRRARWGGIGHRRGLRGLACGLGLGVRIGGAGHAHGFVKLLRRQCQFFASDAEHHTIRGFAQEHAFPHLALGVGQPDLRAGLLVGETLDRLCRFRLRRQIGCGGGGAGNRTHRFGGLATQGRVNFLRRCAIAQRRIHKAVELVGHGRPGDDASALRGCLADPCQISQRLCLGVRLRIGGRSGNRSRLLRGWCRPRRRWLAPQSSTAHPDSAAIGAGILFSWRLGKRFCDRAQRRANRSACGKGRCQSFRNLCALVFAPGRGGNAHDNPLLDRLGCPFHDTGFQHAGRRTFDAARCQQGLQLTGGGGAGNVRGPAPAKDCTQSKHLETRHRHTGPGRTLDADILGQIGRAFLHLLVGLGPQEDGRQREREAA